MGKNTENLRTPFKYLVCYLLLRNWHPSRPGSTHFSSIAKFLPIQNLFLHKINSFLMFSGCRALVKNPFWSKIPKNIVEKRDGKQKYCKKPSLAHNKFEQCCHFFICFFEKVMYSYFCNFCDKYFTTYYCLQSSRRKISSLHKCGSL